MDETSNPCPVSSSDATGHVGHVEHVERHTSEGHPSNNPTMEDVDALFTYHAPNDRQLLALGEVRTFARGMACVILRNCPPCADRSAAIRALRDCVMTANAAIMLEGK